jgi:hypothetical protein
MIIDPAIKRYAINISLQIFEGHSAELIKEQIISKLSDYFLQNQRHDKIPKSDLIAIIEGIDGVDSVNLWFISELNEKAKAKNPNATDIGIDDFGDIIYDRNELVLIRGGWYDRYGILIEDGTSYEKTSAVNIAIEKITPKSYNATKHQSNMKNLKK